MFRLLEENLIKLLAYGMAALVALLMTIHVLGSVDWLALLPDLGLWDTGDQGPRETAEGCLVMPDGLIICETDLNPEVGDAP